MGRVRCTVSRVYVVPDSNADRMSFVVFWGSCVQEYRRCLFVHLYSPKNRHNTLCAVQKKKTQY